MAPSRRRLLAGLGAVTTSALAGCSERIWSLVEGSTTDHLSVHVKTPPPDDDPMAAKIASQLAENLQTAGVDAVPEPTAKPELFRSALMAHDFDVFVTRHPGFDDPDGIRPLLHSRLSGEQGWQNPFGISEPTVDEFLEAQRVETGELRRETIVDLAEYLVETVPYTVVAFPDHVSAADASLGLSRTPRTPSDYAALLYRSPPGGRDGEPLRAGVFAEGMTDRLNPIAVDLEGVEVALDLLYDPLVRHTEEGYVPWLADDITWSETDSGLEARVVLRDGTTWHDGTALTADDVTFTTRLLADTSLGESESPVPAPRYRGRRTVIEDVSKVGSRAVRFSFDGVSEDVARRALTIPVLPEHVWDRRATSIDEHMTEALAWDNDEPVGSGLFAFADSTSGQRLELEAFEDHVLFRDGVPGRSGSFDGTREFERVEFRISPNSGAAVESLREGDLDLITDWLPPSALEAIGEGDGVSILSTPTRSFYMIGFNTRNEALSNYRFRGVVARLVDREYVVSEFFGGRAIAARTTGELVGLLEGAEDVPDAFEEFPGSQGVVDEVWVRSALEEAGFHYENGNLFV
ncbi:ABC transporter substrate-binding protein [Natrialbaceae archaeon A-gly3]